jgi:hypothetical protein
MKAGLKYSMAILAVLALALLMVRVKKRPISESVPVVQAPPPASSPKVPSANPSKPASASKPDFIPSTRSLFSEKPWGKDQYEVTKHSHAGVLSVRKGGKEAYSLVSQVSVYRCESSQEICVRFPNGQKVIASQDLLKRIPPILIEVAGRPWYHQTGP